MSASRTGRRGGLSRAGALLRPILLPAVLVLLAVPPSAAAETTEALRREGARHYEGRRYFQAIEAFEKALELAGSDEERAALRSDLAHALAALGLEYLNASETRLAETMFERALGHSDDYFARFGLGYLYLIRRQDAEARTHLLAALGGRADYAPTHKLLALLQYRQGRTKEAVSRLEEALELDPADEEGKLLVARWRKELELATAFRTLAAPRFQVRIDPAVPVETGERILSALDVAYREIGDELGSWPEDAVPVVLFSEDMFREATGSAHWVGGFYDGQIKLPVPDAASRDREAFGETVSVLRHEFAHVLIGRIAAECPVWLNEGLAQYFERRHPRTEVFRRLHENRNARIPLAKMPARLGDVTDVELARWMYLQGLGLVEFLAAEYKPFRLRLLLLALDEEHSVSRTFERTYGLALEDIEKRWWEAVEEAAR